LSVSGGELASGRSAHGVLKSCPQALAGISVRVVIELVPALRAAEKELVSLERFGNGVFRIDLFTANRIGCHTES
jgi:hypothetical protein